MQGICLQHECTPSSQLEAQTERKGRENEVMLFVFRGHSVQFLLPLDARGSSSVLGPGSHSSELPALPPCSPILILF